MNSQSILAIGELYDEYLGKLAAAGFIGFDAEETARDMARLYLGLRLLREVDMEFPNEIGLYVADQHKYFVDDWLDDLKEAVDEGLI